MSAQTRIAGYVRVSTREQRDEHSHLGQRQAIAEWAARNGHEPGDWDQYQEISDSGQTEDWSPIDGEATGDIIWHEDIAISGTSDEREAYNRLLDTHEIYDKIVVRELSRFGRDTVTVLQGVEEITDGNCEFISIKEGFDTDGAMGRAFLKMMAVVNDLYADLRAEQAVKAAERRKEKGLPVGRPEKVNQEMMVQIYDWRKKGLSYSGIARLVEDNPSGPDEISRETIRRYCTKADIEREQ
jgi:DNA invertase Pin-like site-specific DNA recombinase